MSQMFSALGVSSSGLRVFRGWLDSVSDNLANLDTVRRTSEAAYQARYIEVTSDPNGGANITAARFGDAEGIVVSDPTNPLADENGLVRRPDIDMNEQMTSLMVAQRGYQANLTVVERVRDAYQAALQIGK
jgi:flagellar basal-body rod protein FlgC